MRILFCLGALPVRPFDGFQLAVHHLVDELRRDHDVRLLALSEHTPADASTSGVEVGVVAHPPPGLPGNLADVARGLLLREPSRVERRRRALAGPLQEVLAGFQPDVVHVSHGELARVNRHLGSVPAVLASLDAWHLNTRAQLEVSTGLRRAYLQLELPRIQRFQATEFRRFDRVTTVSRQDADALIELDARIPVVAIPNGVELAPARPTPASERPRILFHGVMGYAPNVRASRLLVEEVLPLVRRTHPTVRVDLVGREPAPEVEALADVPGVRVTGAVPQLGSWFESANVYVCPMVSGTGIKNKLLEAFAHGVPAVATPLALQGIDAVPDLDVLVGATPAELATQVARLLDDPQLAAKVGAAGRNLVERDHSWARVAGAYVQAYRDAIAAWNASSRGRR